MSEATLTQGAMLVERVESEGRNLVAVGREIGEADEKAVMAAWRDLCAARRKWSLTYREEVGAAHEADASMSSEAHQKMVGPAQEAYERMVGAQTTRTLPSGSSIGVGEFLYN